MNKNQLLLIIQAQKETIEKLNKNISDGHEWEVTAITREGIILVTEISLLQVKQRLEDGSYKQIVCIRKNRYETK